MNEKDAPKLTSKTIKKSLIKFKAGAPNPSQEIDLTAQAWSKKASEAMKAAEELWTDYLEMGSDEFCELITREPPTPHTIHRLVGLALSTDDPNKTAALGREKAKGYQARKVQVLTEWAKVKGTPLDKKKHHFAVKWAPKLGLAESTIQRWLRNK